MRIIIIISVVFVIVLVVVLRFRGGKGRFPWYEFFSRGRKEGFSFKEVRFLKKIVVQSKLQKPQSIYWSTRQLDRCLRPAIQKINADEDIAPEYKLYMTNKLLELRKKAEFNLPKYKKRIRDTSALLPRQKLVVRDRDYGTFVSWVIEVSRRHLAVTQPAGQKEWKSLKWTGKKIGLYFWRAEDAGYFFETKVLQQISHEEYPLLYLDHSNKLERTQKRQSVRVEANIRTNFYPVKYSSAEGVNKAFVSKKKRTGKIIDMSETGCCMIAGKMLNKNDRVKLDFFLTEKKKIVVLGIIIGVSGTGDERVKKYHVMFVKIGPFSKNNILLYVYNIFGEREEKDENKKRKVVNAASAEKK